MNKVPHTVSFAVLFAVSLILWHRPVINTFTLATSDDGYTHILLILPLTLGLIARDWSERDFQPRFWVPAVSVMLAALLLLVWVRWGSLGGTSDLGLAVAMVGLIAWWIASFDFCFGPTALRAFRFPLYFLFWMVPVPAIAMQAVVVGLQRGSALAAQFIFAIVRTPVSREAMTLHIPGLDLEVAAECSSIRSSLMLLVTTMVLAQVLLRTPWRKVLVVLLALPLAAAKNGLRIFTIGMLSTRVDPAFLTGRLHREGGIIFFLITLAVIFLLIWFLRRGETVQPPVPRWRPARS
ncbi:MAG TPA: exosortase/archaeosortase family protein [Terriglobales bacterium]|nr:exosortase/archaeosortase family protein [Terriglobales bacterium]